MNFDLNLLKVLACPETKAALRLASEDELRELNAQIRAGKLVEQGVRELQVALVRVDGAVAYPVLNGIPVLTAEHAIPLNGIRRLV